MDKQAFDTAGLGQKLWSGTKTVASVPLKLMSMSTPKWMYPLAALATVSPVIAYELNRRSKVKPKPFNPEIDMDKAAAAIDDAIRGQAMRNEANRPAPAPASGGLDDFKKMISAAKNRAGNRPQANQEISSGGMRPQPTPGGMQHVTELQTYSGR